MREIVGQGYKKFWNDTNRYRILKGGRGSKKSATTSMWYPHEMARFYNEYGLKPNALVIRRFYNAHKDSTFAQLQWGIRRIGQEAYWRVKLSPLELIYKPSGQKIMFRGLDNPDSITSITVDDGYLCWVWWEEFFQCADEEVFNKVDMSIRGDMPAPLFKQHTGTMNPWSENTWIKKRFFDDPTTNQPGSNITTYTTDYRCNEFLGQDDVALFEEMKIKNPRRYNIEGLGNWGIAEGLIFNNWREEEFDYANMRIAKDNYGKTIHEDYFGLDFGYSNDPTAFIGIFVNRKAKKIYIYDEAYMYGATNKAIYDTIVYKGHKKERICADSEDPRTINELKIQGLEHIYSAKKGQGSVNFGIQKIQDFELIVHPRCTNTIVELSNYCWDKDKESGKPINKPIDEFNHLMDTLRYACEEIELDTFSW